MMIRAAFAATAATLVLGGCATTPDPHPLTGTEWQLTAIDTANSTTTLTPAVQRQHTIAFREEGALEAQLDCNRGRATWSAQQPMNGAGAITIGPVASTRMLCPEPSFGEALAQGLTGAERFITTLDGRQLVLETGTLRYTFTAAE